MRDTFLGFTVHVHHKGGNSQAEMNRANQISNQQLGLMQQQLSMQQQQLAQVNPVLQQIIKGGGLMPGQEAALTGIAGQEKAALTSEALNSLPQQYNNLLGQLNAQLAQRGVTGGQFAGGGQIGQQFGALGAALGNQQSNLLSNVEMQNAQNLFGIQQEKMQGLNNALNQSLGLGGLYGSQALGFGSQGVGALGQGVTAAQNADQAQTGFWGSLVGGLAGLGGATLTGKPWK